MHSKAPTQTKAQDFTTEQELMHAAVHVLGILFGIFGIPLLIYSAIDKDFYSLMGITVYGICFMMVFTFSTLYHSNTRERRKRLFKKLDRISIYFLIAGTYTPIVKLYLFDNTGINLLTTLWCLVVVGILFEIYYPDRYPNMSVLFYLLMGLMFLFIPGRFFAAMPQNVSMLVMSGIVLYVVGVVFYVWHGWKYHHVLWHAFVLIGSICHYLAVWDAL